MSDDGVLIERVLDADSYGDAPRYLTGPVVDRIRVYAKKAPSGEIEEVTAKIHLSEKIVPSSVEHGVAVRVVKDDHSPAAPLTGRASIDSKDPNMVLWTLTGDEWASLVAAPGAAQLEIAVTNELRAEGWGTTPVAPPTDWQRLIAPVESDAQRPVIVRETLATLAAECFDKIPPGKDDDKKLYEVSDLYLAASKESKAKLLTGFKSAPYIEPACGLALFRDRWYDPGTGSWLTPDSYGTHDSSNLYSYCAGNPIGCSDPTGQWAWWDRHIDDLGEEGWREARGFLSGAAGAAPLLGEATDALQFFSGYDWIAGEKLTPWQQGLAGASFLLPFGGAKALRDAGEAGFDFARSAEKTVAASADAEHYLISQRRIARYEANLLRLQGSGASGERLAELSGRIEMLKEGFLREGHGIYEAQTRLITTVSGKQIRRRVGGKGIDSIYRKFGTEGELAILESKWRKGFTIGGNPETLLGRGILDPNAVGRVYFQQMSPDWIQEVRSRLLRSEGAGAFEAGQLLMRHPRATRFINVLNANGQAVLHQMP